MAEHEGAQTTRRGLLKHLAIGTGLGIAPLLGGCRRRNAASPRSGSGGGRTLRALFSNGGLTGTWCKLGRDTAMLWGDLLNVAVTYVDGEFDSEKQRKKLDLKAEEDWDFCAFQSHLSGTLEEPAKKLAERNIPIISMDTLLVEKDRLREVGAWLQVGPDQIAMGESSTAYLVEKIGRQGKVIHIGGASAHSGAQGREKGFNNVISQCPEIEVMGGGVRWCDWNIEKARASFSALLKQSEEPIAGAFFHNDDMAIACVPAIKDTRHEGMVITAVDGQKEGLGAVKDGSLDATTVNPTCMIHMLALVIGQFIVRNEESLDDVPMEIVCPSPLVAQETGNLDAMIYMSDPKHCLV